MRRETIGKTDHDMLRVVKDYKKECNDEKIVCITTGHGLKDPDIAVKMSEKPIEVEAEIEAIEDVLGLKPEMAVTG